MTSNVAGAFKDRPDTSCAHCTNPNLFYLVSYLLCASTFFALLPNSAKGERVYGPVWTVIYYFYFGSFGCFFSIGVGRVTKLDGT